MGEYCVEVFSRVIVGCKLLVGEIESKEGLERT